MYITQLDQENNIHSNTGEESSRLTVLSSRVEMHPVETDQPSRNLKDPVIDNDGFLSPDGWLRNWKTLFCSVTFIQ